MTEGDRLTRRALSTLDAPAENRYNNSHFSSSDSVDRLFGTGGIPFTTAGAYAEYQDFTQPGNPLDVTQEPTNLMPWSATGRLQWTSGVSCTAALIGPNIAVTAASCVCNYGSNTVFSGTATFTSAHFDNKYFLKASVESVYPALPYLQGTDSCVSPGKECENDIAVLQIGSVFEPATSPFLGERPGVLAGFYQYVSGDYSYVSYAGYIATQITALGYAQNLENGNRMIRTDSIGIQTTPNQVKIGSAMTEGAMGCPFLINFGTVQTDSAAPGSGNQPNTVVAVSGLNTAPAGSLVMTGSRFNTNSKYPGVPNIQTLVNTFCCQLSLSERANQCGSISTCLDEVSPSPGPPPPGPPATTDWRLSSAGATCDQTCADQGLSCNINPMRSVLTPVQARQVSLYCGVDASTLGELGQPYTDSPGIWNNLLQYEGSQSLCNAFYDGSQRFCCCGSDCPLVSSPSPSPPSPSPSPSPPGPPPPAGTVPGQPVSLAQTGNTQNSITISWTDGSLGNPQETYDVKCMMYGEGCSATPLQSVTGIQRGAQTATVTGLFPSTLYSCFVEATNSAGSACSASLTVNYQNSGSCTARGLLEANATKPRDAVCGTPNPTSEQIQQSLDKQKATFGATASAYSTNGTFGPAAVFSATVPVYFYTCQNNPTITSTQLNNQINVLNTDYASAGIGFSLIETIVCSGTEKTAWMNNLGTNTDINSGFNYLRSLAASLNKPGFLICLGDWDAGLLGIAELGLTSNPVNFNDPGTLPGGSYAGYNLGRTMTHEVGHNMGLYHVFDQGCSGEGDYVSDTPKGNTNYGCPLNTNACSSPGLDAINNFMDYTDDCCMTVFSPRQGLVMQAEITQSKPQWLN